MTPHDYEHLLAAANLAHHHPKWGFAIFVDRWKMFLDGHHFYSSNGTGSFEVDTKRLDIDAFILGTSAKHRVRVHVIQFGVSTDCRPLLLELTSSEPLTLDEEVPMQEEWHHDERKCTFVILARDLLLLDLNIVQDDRPSVAVTSSSRILSP
jgi:hypothetical protein